MAPRKSKFRHFKSSSLLRFFPFLIWAKTVTGKSAYADLLAGLTGAVIVLPQGIAYALIAGLPPEYGLYTAIITPIVAGLFGSSIHLISGPTAAISIVVMSVTSSIAAPGSSEFVSIALTITLLAGLIQFGFGVARFGVLVNFISHTVVIGFTAGAAILIGTSQLKYVLSVPIERGSSFISTWSQLIHHIPDANILAVVIAAVTIVATLVIKKINRKLPSMLLGMIIASIFAWLMDSANNGIALVGALQSSLPGLAVPSFSHEQLSVVLPGAFAIAVLGLVEAVSIARAIGIRSGQRIDGNQEFIGQGLSNVVGSFFSCYAGSGSFTRSGANYDAGAQSPLSAIFAALILVLILLLIPQVTAYLPLPAMGGAILLIAWNLIDVPHIVQIVKSHKEEAAVLTVTFLSTLFIELEFAIYVGVILSLTLYLRRTSKPKVSEVAPIPFNTGTYLRSVALFDLKECPQLKIIRIDGSAFFGAVDYIQLQIRKISARHNEPSYILLHCSGINFIDIAGAEMLYQEALKLQRRGGRLSFCAMNIGVKKELERMYYLEKLGDKNFYLTTDDALKELVPLLDQNICDTCDVRIFQQCPEKKPAQELEKKEGDDTQTLVIQTQS
jgi:SulP family sulfate permease